MALCEKLERKLQCKFLVELEDKICLRLKVNHSKNLCSRDFVVHSIFKGKDIFSLFEVTILLTDHGINGAGKKSKQDFLSMVMIFGPTLPWIGISEGVLYHSR